jgi:hypothetical protein
MNDQFRVMSVVAVVGGETMKLLACLAAMMLLASPVAAADKSSLKYAQLGDKAYAQFQCAAIASFLDDKKSEQGRLFMAGLEGGREFLKAARDGKVEKDDIHSNLPLSFFLRLRGPSIDFILGSVWEAAVFYASEDMIKVDCPECTVVNTLGRMKLERAFRVRNCEFLQ